MKKHWLYLFCLLIAFNIDKSNAQVSSSDEKPAYLDVLLYKKQVNTPSETLQLLNISNPSSDFGNAAIEYNGKLYFTFKNSKGVSLLAQYNGSNFTIITNPPGYNVFSLITVYNNNLYFNMLNAYGICHLAKFDGIKITVIPNPQKAYVDQSETADYNTPIIYKNMLCLNHDNQLIQYNGQSVSYIPVPKPGKSSFVQQGIGMDTHLSPVGWIVYKGDLYFNYKYTSGSSTGDFCQLARYDGVKVTLIANPDKGWGTDGDPVVYNNKLYVAYVNPGYFRELAQFDDTSLTIVSTDYAYQGSPIIYNNLLYFGYFSHHDQVYHKSSARSENGIAQFDGVSMTPVQGVSPFAFSTSLPIVYNNKLYLRGLGMKCHLVEFDGSKTTTIPNADQSGSYFFQNWYSGPIPIVFNNKLYIDYSSQLAQYDGTELELIANPTAGTNTFSYEGYSAVYDNKLYVYCDDSKGLHKWAVLK